MLNEKEYAEMSVCDAMTQAARNMSSIAHEMRQNASTGDGAYVFLLIAKRLDGLSRETMHAVDSFPDFNEFLARCYDDHTNQHNRPANLREPQPPRVY